MCHLPSSSHPSVQPSPAAWPFHDDLDAINRRSIHVSTAPWLLRVSASNAAPARVRAVSECVLRPHLCDLGGQY